MLKLHFKEMSVKNETFSGSIGHNLEEERNGKRYVVHMISGLTPANCTSGKG